MEDKRNEQRLRWWKIHGEKYSTKPSMTRRKVGHDYCDRCIYMITIVVAGRRPLLGTLCAPDENHQKAWVKASSLGLAVKGYWHEIPFHYPHVKVIRSQIMPDHFHGIIFVTKKTKMHLGAIINNFKKSCSFKAKEIGIAPLWESNYNDLILKGPNQLENMNNYLLDNPQRLWIKRQSPNNFTVKRIISAGGQQLESLGNQFLLDYPLKVAVKCTRRLTEEQIQEQVEYFLEMALRGVVLVSPGISPGEKKVMKAAQAANCKVIKIVDNGFTELSKPSGEDFNACARGDLLLISPWKHHNERIELTKKKCDELNLIAARIAKGE